MVINYSCHMSLAIPDVVLASPVISVSRWRLPKPKSAFLEVFSIFMTPFEYRVAPSGVLVPERLQ